MDKGHLGRIVLIGFSATGKSAAGLLLAQELGWELVDTDAAIVQQAGASIDEIFRLHGEPHFRQMEKQALASALGRDRVVVAAGGGVVVDPENRLLLKSKAFTVCLDADATVIADRLSRQGASEVRPLLSGDDASKRIRGLQAQRLALYAEAADWTVRTDYLTPQETCQEVLRGWSFWRRGQSAKGGPASCAEDAPLDVVTANAHYPVMVGWGTLDSAGDAARRVGLHGSAYVVSDSNVFPRYGSRLMAGLERAGFNPLSFIIPAGEQSKDLDRARQIYDWLIKNRAERTDCVFALGGGVVGDLAGFVSATFVRGMALMQVPTSLVAMVDAAIGGKTAVDHPAAKNMIGAFHQPRLVFADVETLRTLPERELRSGWAEVIKHGLILDAGLFGFIEETAGKLQEIEPEAAVQVVRRSASVKVAIVSEDEREKGRRTLLNYGHTIGHGLEAATDYGHFLHGEAVALGMAGAGMISERLGFLQRYGLERQRDLLLRFGLPAKATGVDAARVMDAIRLDKKVRSRRINWVLLSEIGQAFVSEEVPDDLAIQTVRELTS